MKHIAISIEYAGLTLPVVKNDAGVDCVPLKPLCDLFGLKWETQRTKVSERFYADYLGVCVQKAWVATPLKGGSSGEFQEQTCIRLDRVAAFMMTINPDRVRANGNEEGAAFLQAKLTEWADALHDYETFGSAHNPRHADARLALQRTNSLLKAMRQRSATKHPTDKLLLDATIRRLAIEAGIEAPEIALQPESSTGDLFAGQ